MMVGFELHGKPLGEVDRVIITDKSIITLLKNGEVRPMPRHIVAPTSLIVSELHRNGVEVVYD